MNSQRRTPTPPVLRRGRRVVTAAAKVKIVEISGTPAKQAQKKQDMDDDGSFGKISPLTPINAEAPRRSPSPSPHRNALRSPARTPSRRRGTANRSPARTPSSPQQLTARESPVRSERLITTKQETTVDAAKAIARARTIQLIRHQKVSPLLEEEYHRYRVAYNRLLQWRFGNARGEASMAATHRIAQQKLLNTWVKISAIRNSTSEKQARVQKLKQDLKLYDILKSELKLLDEWSRMERKNVTGVDRVVRKLSAASVCLPVDDDAKAGTESVHDAMWEAMEVAENIQAMLLDLHSRAKKMHGHLRNFSVNTLK